MTEPSKEDVDRIQRATLAIEHALEHFMQNKDYHDLGVISNNVASLRHIIQGWSKVMDGPPSLEARMAVMETTLDEVRQSVKRMLWGLLGACGTMLLGMVSMLYQQMVK